MFYKSALQALLSKWDHPSLLFILKFLIDLHAKDKTVVFCWLPSHMGISGNEQADAAAKAALEKEISECLLPYSDSRQYIGQYVRDLWQREWDLAVHNKLHAIILENSHLLIDRVKNRLFWIDLDIYSLMALL